MPSSGRRYHIMPLTAHPSVPQWPLLDLTMHDMLGEWFVHLRSPREGSHREGEGDYGCCEGSLLPSCHSCSISHLDRKKACISRNSRIPMPKIRNDACNIQLSPDKPTNMSRLHNRHNQLLKPDQEVCRVTCSRISPVPLLDSVVCCMHHS
jgi:hypothetical protein